jgi:hypothetical protein
MMNNMLKRVFYAGLIGISLFEILNVYFIMPMPGSQEMNSINIAYFLYTHRWIFRIIFLLMILAGIYPVFRKGVKILPAVSLAVTIIISVLFNFKMNAESMFKQPEHLIFKSKDLNKIDPASVVIGVENNGQVKAYPVQFISYHHQIQDSVGGKPLIITYCNVCRTGRVYEPAVNGKHEKFRLVGMDHYNAMFEDYATGSWWRQATGEAITGPLKGNVLPEFESMQLTIKKLFELYPEALVMQKDQIAKMRYDTLRKFEQGLSTSRLTRTDTLSWKNKSWVIGVEIGSTTKAYDWNILKEKHLISDKMGDKSYIVVMSSDNQSFAAYETLNGSYNFMLRNDTIFSGSAIYDFSGRSLTSQDTNLKRIKAYQEFWHSWSTFHPQTIKE